MDGAGRSERKGYEIEKKTLKIKKMLLSEANDKQ